MLIFLISVLLLTFYSSEPLLVFCSLMALPILYKLFWQPRQPNTIFLALILFWLSITVKIFYADFTGLSFESLSESPNIIQTAYISLVGFLIFSAGIYVILPRKINFSTDNYFVNNIEQYNVKRVSIVYCISILLKVLIASSLFRIEGLSQLLNALLVLRDGMIFLLVYIFFAKTKSLTLPLLLVSIEILIGFTSYFSNFKDVIILFIISATSFQLALNKKKIFILLLVSFTGLYTLLIWQAVKGEYRNFLSGGERSQTVVVDKQTAFNHFIALARTAKINDPELWYQSIDRLSYIEFFSQATDNVPSNIPFENGKIWKKNLEHILVPRFLNPNKEAIDDSKMVNSYATRKVAEAQEGASFSLGFFAESYIDFGYVFMFIPILLIGMLIGFIYKFILYKSFNTLWGFAFTVPLWMYINCNGTPGAKLLGWLIWYILVFFLINRYIVPKIDRYLRN